MPSPSSLAVCTYDASNADGSLEKFLVNPEQETVADLLSKLRSIEGLINPCVRVGMRLYTYVDYVRGSLINDTDADPCVLTKTLAELQREGRIVYEADDTELNVHVDGCRTEAEAAEYTLQQSWRNEYSIAKLAKRIDVMEKERGVSLKIAVAALQQSNSTPSSSVSPYGKPAEASGLLVRAVSDVAVSAAKRGDDTTLRFVCDELLIPSGLDSLVNKINGEAETTVALKK